MDQQVKEKLTASFESVKRAVNLVKLSITPKTTKEGVSIRAGLIAEGIEYMHLMSCISDGIVGDERVADELISVSKDYTDSIDRFVATINRYYEGVKL